MKSENIQDLEQTLMIGCTKPLPAVVLQSRARAGLCFRVAELTGELPDEFWGVDTDRILNIWSHQLVKGRCVVMTVCDCGCGGVQMCLTKDKTIGG